MFMTTVDLGHAGTFFIELSVLFHLSHLLDCSCTSELYFYEYTKRCVIFWLYKAGLCVFINTVKISKRLINITTPSGHSVTELSSYKTERCWGNVARTLHNRWMSGSQHIIAVFPTRHDPVSSILNTLISREEVDCGAGVVWGISFGFV